MASQDQLTERPVGKVFYHGWQRECPSHVEVSLFPNYLSIRNECNNCGLQLHNHQADEAWPYFTVFKTAHVVVPALIVSGWVESPELWIQMTVELTLIAWLSLVIYREARA